MDKLNYTIRGLKKDEVPILEQMLYEAIYQPARSNPLPLDVIKTPEINVYIDNFFNYKDDYCFVAESNGIIIGAVWVRLLNGKIRGYGNIDDTTPEFAISLLKNYRNKGIGTAMMKKMIEHLKKNGYTQTSLSVAKDNYAVRLYENVGFKVIAEKEEDYLMVLTLS